jgi:hypothetical protein
MSRPTYTLTGTFGRDGSGSYSSLKRSSGVRKKTSRRKVSAHEFFKYWRERAGRSLTLFSKRGCWDRRFFLQAPELLEPNSEIKVVLGDLHGELARQLQSQRKPGQKWIVKVDDNYHFMDEDERYILEEFDTEEEAVAAAKRIIDKFFIRRLSTRDNSRQLTLRLSNDGRRPVDSRFCIQRLEIRRAALS